MRAESKVTASQTTMRVAMVGISGLIEDAVTTLAVTKIQNGVTKSEY